MSFERYKLAKKETKKAVQNARAKVYKKLYEKLNTKEVEKDIYNIARIIERKTRDLCTVSVDTVKRQTLRQLFNRSEQCLTCQHLQKTSRRQADDQFLPIPEGQSSNLNLTDPVKQTVGQVLPLKRPRQPMMLS